MKSLNKKEAELLKMKLTTFQALLTWTQEVESEDFAEYHKENPEKFNEGDDDALAYGQMIGCLERSVDELENAIAWINSFSWNQ